MIEEVVNPDGNAEVFERLLTPFLKEHKKEVKNIFKTYFSNLYDVSEEGSKNKLLKKKQYVKEQTEVMLEALYATELPCTTQELQKLAEDVSKLPDEQ